MSCATKTKPVPRLRMTPSTTARRARSVPCSNASRSMSRISVIGDDAVHLGAAVAREVEQRVLVVGAEVEIARGEQHLVAVRRGAGNDLSGGGDDLALGQGRDTFFEATLRHADDPRAVLVRAGGHHQIVVEAGEPILARIG